MSYLTHTFSVIVLMLHCACAFANANDKGRNVEARKREIIEYVETIQNNTEVLFVGPVFVQQFIGCRSCSQKKKKDVDL